MTIEPKNKRGLAKLAARHGLPLEVAAEQLLDGAIEIVMAKPADSSNIVAELQFTRDAIRRGKELVAEQRKIYARLREEYINLRAMNLAHDTVKEAADPALKG